MHLRKCKLHIFLTLDEDKEEVENFKKSPVEIFISDGSKEEYGKLGLGSKLISSTVQIVSLEWYGTKEHILRYENINSQKPFNRL